MSRAPYTEIERRLLRFVLGWIVTFLITFQPVGWLIGGMRWYIEAIVTPVVCSLGGILIFPFLSQFLAKRIRKAADNMHVSRKRLRRLWNMCELPIWTHKECNGFWHIWYTAAANRAVMNDPLQDAWFAMLGITSIETGEHAPELEIEPVVTVEPIAASVPTEPATQPVTMQPIEDPASIILPAKIASAPIPATSYRTTAPLPVESATATPAHAESELEAEQTVSPSKVFKYDLDKWQQIIAKGKRREPVPPPSATPQPPTEPIVPAPEPILLPSEPTGVVEEEIHPTQLIDEPIHEITADLIAHELADHDVAIDYHAELPEPEVSEVTEEVQEALELPEAPIAKEPEPEPIPEPPSPEPEIQVPPIPRIEPRLPSVTKFELPPQPARPSYSYTPPKLPPLPIYTSATRQREEAAPVPKRPSKPPKRFSFSRDNAKNMVVTLVILAAVVVAGFSVLGLVKYVTDTISTSPELSPEASMPEPVRLPSLKFTLDLGERSTLKQANQELNMLQENGFAAYLYRELKRDGKIRMRVGHFARKRDAQEIGRKMIDQNLTKRFSIVAPDSTEDQP